MYRYVLIQTFIIKMISGAIKVITIYDFVAFAMLLLVSFVYFNP